MIVAPQPVRPIHVNGRVAAIEAAQVFQRNSRKISRLFTHGEIRKANATASGFAGYLISRHIEHGHLAWALNVLAQHPEGGRA